MTDKQKRFVEEYLIDLNATQAAIRSGYSVKNADTIGLQLLNKTQVAAEIGRRMAERSKRLGVNADRIVTELAKIAFANAGDIIDPVDGCIKEDAAPEDLAAIQSIKVKTMDGAKMSSMELEVKLSEKTKALELLGKHIGMWNDKIDVNVTLPVVISGDDKLED